MILEILGILKSDTQLGELLGASVSDSKIYPFYADKVTDCITYTTSPVTDNGIKKQDRLDLTVISLSMGRAEAILNRVKKLIVTVGDDRLINNTLKVELNGGGTLLNDETKTFHYKAYFYITRR